MKWVSYTRSISSRIGEENPSNTIAEQNERIARYLKKCGCRGRSIRLVSNLQLWKMTFAVQTKLPKKLQSISMERPLIRFVRNLLPIARITLKKVH